MSDGAHLSLVCSADDPNSDTEFEEQAERFFESKMSEVKRPDITKYDLEIEAEELLLTDPGVKDEIFKNVLLHVGHGVVGFESPLDHFMDAGGSTAAAYRAAHADKSKIDLVKHLRAWR